MRHAFVLAALAWAITANPTPAKLANRDADNVNNLPANHQDCNGNDYSPDDIKTAINFAWQAVKDGKQYQWTGGKKPAKNAKYPHRFTPTQMDMAWDQFGLANCANDPNNANVGGFQEYPIKGSSAWDGSDNSQAGAQGNDRVIFQYIDGDSTAYFCGIVRHPGKDGVNNHFQMCDDIAPDSGALPAAVPPYATGTCSLHLTQWDYEFDTPRYDVEVRIFDDAKNTIGFQERTPSDGDTPVFIGSALEDWLTVTAESQNDYIAFDLPPQTWPSNGEFGPGDTPNQCSVGGWDCSDYPCYRQMDCSFGCAWGGGESSQDLENGDPSGSGANDGD